MLKKFIVFGLVLSTLFMSTISSAKPADLAQIRKEAATELLKVSATPSSLLRFQGQTAIRFIFRHIINEAGFRRIAVSSPGIASNTYTIRVANDNG